MAKSKSQSQSTQTTNQQDNRIAASDNAIAVGAGATLIQNDVSDTIATSAIEETAKTARDVVSTGADLVRDVQGQSLDFAAGAVESSRSIADKAIEASQDTVRTTADLASTLSEVAIANLEKNKRDPTDDTLQSVTSTIAKFGTIAVGVIALAVVGYFVFRRK